MAERTGQAGVVLALALVAAGIALSGWFIGHGFYLGRAGERYVTVKGLSERDVKADLALWPIRFVAPGNNLSQVQAEVEADAKMVRAFLQEHGVAAENIDLQSLEVTDRAAQAYGSGQYEQRYIMAQTLMVRSNEVDIIAAASQDVGQLVASGVVLNNEYYGPMGSGPTYLFNGLTEIKPQMLAEATRRAREAARQFAEDAGSTLGSIRRADQGVFVILPRDKAPMLQEEKQVYKTVRVVSTIQYYLED